MTVQPAFQRRDSSPCVPVGSGRAPEQAVAVGLASTVLVPCSGLYLFSAFYLAVYHVCFIFDDLNKTAVPASVVNNKGRRND